MKYFILLSGTYDPKYSQVQVQHQNIEQTTAQCRKYRPLEPFNDEKSPNRSSHLTRRGSVLWRSCRKTACPTGMEGTPPEIGAESHVRDGTRHVRRASESTNKAIANTARGRGGRTRRTARDAGIIEKSVPGTICRTGWYTSIG